MSEVAKAIARFADSDSDYDSDQDIDSDSLQKSLNIDKVDYPRLHESEDYPIDDCYNKTTTHLFDTILSVQQSERSLIKNPQEKMKISHCGAVFSLKDDTNKIENIYKCGCKVYSSKPRFDSDDKYKSIELDNVWTCEKDNIAAIVNCNADYEAKTKQVKQLIKSGEYENAQVMCFKDGYFTLYFNFTRVFKKTGPYHIPIDDYLELVKYLYECNIRNDGASGETRHEVHYINLDTHFGF